MKLPLALASLAALAASAAADCSEIWRGQLHYSQNFAAGDGKDGWVQYNNGALTIDHNADHGVEGKLQRCGEREFHSNYFDGKDSVARLVLPDNKCLRKRGHHVSVGDCDSHANVIRPTFSASPRSKFFALDAWYKHDYESPHHWYVHKNGSLGFGGDPTSDQIYFNLVGY